MQSNVFVEIEVYKSECKHKLLENVRFRNHGGCIFLLFSGQKNHLEVAEKAHNSHRQNITYAYLFIILHNVYFTEM